MTPRLMWIVDAAAIVLVWATIALPIVPFLITIALVMSGRT